MIAASGQSRADFEVREARHCQLAACFQFFQQLSTNQGRTALTLVPSIFRPVNLGSWDLLTSYSLIIAVVRTEAATQQHNFKCRIQRPKWRKKRCDAVETRHRSTAANVVSRGMLRLRLATIRLLLATTLQRSWQTGVTRHTHLTAPLPISS